MYQTAPRWVRDIMWGSGHCRCHHVWTFETIVRTISSQSSSPLLLQQLPDESETSCEGADKSLIGSIVTMSVGQDQSNLNQKHLCQEKDSRPYGWKIPLPCGTAGDKSTVMPVPSVWVKWGEWFLCDVFCGLWVDVFLSWVDVVCTFEVSGWQRSTLDNFTYAPKESKRIDLENPWQIS